MSASLWPTLFVAEVCFWPLEKSPEIGGPSGMGSLQQTIDGSHALFCWESVSSLGAFFVSVCVFVSLSVCVCVGGAGACLLEPSRPYSGPLWLLCQSVCAQMCCLLRFGLTLRLRGNDTISVCFFWFKRCFKLVFYSHGKSEHTQSGAQFCVCGSFISVVLYTMQIV